MQHDSHPMETHRGANHAGHANHYTRLVAMTALSFVAMYALMYAMVNARENVYSNINQVYMAGLMAAPMVPLEILLMGTMYRNTRMNAAIIATSVVAALALFMCIRRQTAESDSQFLRSMIPHHAGAILMCERASVRDAETKRLCGNIVASQRAEIAQMKAMIERLDNAQ
jgi:uncharacterized protein (DUF305 family)